MTTMTVNNMSSIAQPLADLINARYAFEKRATFWRDLALAAIRQLHDQRVEIARQRRQIERMAAELRELRRHQVQATLHLPERAAA